MANDFKPDYSFLKAELSSQILLHRTAQELLASRGASTAQKVLEIDTLASGFETTLRNIGRFESINPNQNPPVEIIAIPAKTVESTTKTEVSTGIVSPDTKDKKSK